MKLFNQAKKFGAVVTGVALPVLYSGVTHAALVATDVTAVKDEIAADANMVFTNLIVLVGTVLAMTIGIKLLKRFGNKV